MLRCRLAGEEDLIYEGPSEPCPVNQEAREEGRCWG